MKKFFTILTTIFVVSIFTLTAQTTLEEYNYVTKGYKVQLESGLDMKKGYEIESIETQTTSERSAQLLKLFRVNAGKKEIAAYLIIYKRKGIEDQYICIPNPKSEQDIIDKYWYSLHEGGNVNSSDKLQLIAYLISRSMKW